MLSLEAPHRAGWRPGLAQADAARDRSRGPGYSCANSASCRLCRYADKATCKDADAFNCVQRGHQVRLLLLLTPLPACAS